jgi:hypothetical protein
MNAAPSGHPSPKRYQTAAACAGGGASRSSSRVCAAPPTEQVSQATSNATASQKRPTKAFTAL